MTKVLLLSLAAIWAALFLAACGTDEAACGGINNTGSITGPIATNCSNGNANGSGTQGGGAGTTDRHDTTDNHSGVPEGGA